ncbi:radical SAM/SPASM domain-containing protein [Thermodesulfobacteriota bacterium]
MLIPKHVQIENVTGFCTARCIMCPRESSERKTNIMDNDTFTKILESFKPYRKKMHFLTLHGLGEPLLDKNFTEKVRISKEMGFNGVGFATNCTELTHKVASDLLNSGIDTIICSIDGLKKETHEAIRIGTNFEDIVSNVKNFIKLRNKLRKRTKVLVRFIRQERNKDEWNGYYNYWIKQINPDYGDDVIKFDIHNCGGVLENYEAKDINRNVKLENIICSDVFERMLIFSDGRVALCDGDYNCFFDLGNVLKSDPIEIYNNEIFDHYRKMMDEGKILDLKHCNVCTIPRSRKLKIKD